MTLESQRAHILTGLGDAVWLGGNAIAAGNPACVLREITDPDAAGRRR